MTDEVANAETSVLNEHWSFRFSLIHTQNSDDDSWKVTG